MIVLGIIMGLLLAGCFAYMATMIAVCNSNVLGDTKGTFEEFSQKPFKLLKKADGINPRRL